MITIEGSPSYYELDIQLDKIGVYGLLCIGKYAEDKITGIPLPLRLLVKMKTLNCPYIHITTKGTTLVNRVLQLL